MAISRLTHGSEVEFYFSSSYELVLPGESGTQSTFTTLTDATNGLFIEANRLPLATTADAFMWDAEEDRFMYFGGEWSDGLTGIKTVANINVEMNLNQGNTAQAAMRAIGSRTQFVFGKIINDGSEGTAYVARWRKMSESDPNEVSATNKYIIGLQSNGGLYMYNS